MKIYFSKYIFIIFPLEFLWQAIGLSKNIPTGSVDLPVLDLVRVVVGEGFNLATSSRVHRLID